MRKLPRVTLIFWIMKIAATTLGETGGDLLAQTLKIGYLVSSCLFLAIFAVSVVLQLKATKFHPALYWAVITATSTAGTTISDFMNRSAGLGYAKGALVLITCLAIVFVVWRISGQTLDVENIATFKGELLYWIAILFSAPRSYGKGRARDCKPWCVKLNFPGDMRTFAASRRPGNPNT